MKSFLTFVVIFLSAQTNAFAGIEVVLDKKANGFIGDSMICNAGVSHPGSNPFNPQNKFQKVTAKKVKLDDPTRSLHQLEGAGTSKPDFIIKILEHFQIRLDEVTFSLHAPEYGAHYFVDICTRFPEVEELQSHSGLFATYAMEASTDISIDAVFSDPKDNDYFVDSKFEIKPSMHCDLTTPKVSRFEFLPIGIDMASLNRREPGASEYAEIPDEAIPFEVSPLPVLGTTFPQTDVLPHACMTRIEFIEKTKEQRSSFFPLKLVIGNRFKLAKIQ